MPFGKKEKVNRHAVDRQRFDSRKQRQPGAQPLQTAFHFHPAVCGSLNGQKLKRLPKGVTALEQPAEPSEKQRLFSERPHFAFHLSPPPTSSSMRTGR